VDTVFDIQVKDVNENALAIFDSNAHAGQQKYLYQANAI